MTSSGGGEYRIGQVLKGGYRVIDVRRGGMGVVYICHQPPDRYYAVKTANLAGRHSELFSRYFKAEVDNWIRVSTAHRDPHIVEALLYNEDEDWLFLEFVNGLPLQEITLGGAIQVGHVIDWARGIAAGMDILHREFSLLHRDLKPQNVLVHARGLVAKITDLGIAKVLQEEESENTVIGTTGYRAPETWQGMTDFRSDIFSYGALLYFMVTGAAPSGAEDPFESERVDAPSRKNPRVPEPFDALILKCLAYKPADRFQSFVEILDELEKVEAPAPTDEEQGFRFCDSHGFYSPIRKDLAPCLFCEQARFIEEKLKNALATGDEGRTTQTMVLGGDGVSPVLSPTMSAPAEHGIAMTMTAPVRERAQPAPGGGRRWLLPVAVAVVLLGLGLAYATGAFSKKEPDPGPGNGNHAPGGNGRTHRAEDGKPLLCPVSGCDGEFLPGKCTCLLNPKSFELCDRHFACDDCGRRYETNALVDSCSCLECTGDVKAQ